MIYIRVSFEKKKMRILKRIIRIADNARDIDDQIDMEKLKKTIVKYLNDGYVFR